MSAFGQAARSLASSYRAGTTSRKRTGWAGPTSTALGKHHTNQDHGSAAVFLVDPTAHPVLQLSSSCPAMPPSYPQAASGTGSSGVTLRLYLEKYEVDPAKHGQPSISALKGMAEAALSLSKLSGLTSLPSLPESHVWWVMLVSSCLAITQSKTYLCILHATLFEQNLATVVVFRRPWSKQSVQNECACSRTTGPPTLARIS